MLAGNTTHRFGKVSLAKLLAILLLKNAAGRLLTMPYLEHVAGDKAHRTSTANDKAVLVEKQTTYRFGKVMLLAAFERCRQQSVS